MHLIIDNSLVQFHGLLGRLDKLGFKEAINWKELRNSNYQNWIQMGK